MKLSTSLACGALSLLPATALALSVAARQTTLETITDQYLFDISLDQFVAYRDAQNPNTVIWTSDGCTDSPDNPLGFEFVRDMLSFSARDASPGLSRRYGFVVQLFLRELSLTGENKLGAGLLPP